MNCFHLLLITLFLALSPAKQTPITAGAQIDMLYHNGTALLIKPSDHMQGVHDEDGSIIWTSSSAATERAIFFSPPHMSIGIQLPDDSIATFEIKSVSQYVEGKEIQFICVTGDIVAIIRLIAVTRADFLVTLDLGNTVFGYVCK